MHQKKITKEDLFNRMAKVCSSYTYRQCMLHLNYGLLSRIEILNKQHGCSLSTDRGLCYKNEVYPIQNITNLKSRLAKVVHIH